MKASEKGHKGRSEELSPVEDAVFEQLQSLEASSEHATVSI